MMANLWQLIGWRVGLEKLLKGTDYWCRVVGGLKGCDRDERCAKLDCSSSAIPHGEEGLTSSVVYSGDGVTVVLPWS